MTTKEKRTIAINAEYRLSFPDADNIVIERLTTIDPTKSPNFNPDKHSPILRTEWRSIGKYFSTIPKALAGLLEYSLCNGEATTLREILEEVATFRREIDALFGLDGV